MSKRMWAIVLLVIFLIGIIGIIGSFAMGNNALANYGFMMAIPAGIGSYLLKRMDDGSDENNKE